MTEDPSQKLEEALRNISDTKPSPSDPEKLKLEKEIVKTKKEIEKLVAKKTRGEKLSEKEQAEMNSKVEVYNIIDFGEKENNKPDLLKKKLQEICEQNEIDLERGLSLIVWLKNIDKITNSELKDELLKMFTLVATTSTTNPQLPKELQAKLKHVEPFFDKYF
ncbi:806_t:CDS:2 [Entrophospora sp. SA101]|nr:3914_t:CDS:2 [Entrophospora sp. SA101]CAJ0851677.1 806_t:CDS:2 [Entrophospora sp. SA101]CAJ0855890.1 17296_t:CDS:2 [Entrophospora sp. SA101]